jgi:protein ImuB
MSHIFQPGKPPLGLEERLELESPVELLDALLFVVSVMLDQLILRAKSRVLSLASISITLILEDAALHTCQVRTALPTNDKQLWVKLLHLELEAHPPQAAILAMKVAAEPGCINKNAARLVLPTIT